MLNAAFIAFRETLEAVIVVSLLAAATRPLARSRAWIALGVGLGLAGAVGVAAAAQTIGRWGAGMGHDYLNALVLASAIVMLCGHNLWMARHGRQFADAARRLAGSVARGEMAMSAVTIAIALTVLREGSETALFFFGIFAGTGIGPGALAQGALAGLAAGVLCGLLLYRGLMRIPMRHLFAVTSWLLLLVASGMAAQLAGLLVQADLLPALVQPVWDTSSWVAPDSRAGTLLHALIGYEAQPSATQVFFAASVLVGVGLATQRARRG